MFIGIREDLGTAPKIHPTNKPTTVREAWDGLERDEQAVAEAKKRLERSENYKNYCQIPPGGSLDDVVGGAYGFTHHRLSYRKPAPTMPVGGGSTSNKMLPPDEDRCLTIGEYKRLSDVPDDYELPDKFGPAKECTVRCLPPILLETIATKLTQEVL